MSTEMLPRLEMAMDLNCGRDIDPDVSATLSDFLTYTEHLPSSVGRSLTLIQTLNRKADKLQLLIHRLLCDYANLPQSAASAADPQHALRVRRDISHAYNSLEQCKRMSAAEAKRLEETVVKDGVKLKLVLTKLQALPTPPERDPTPEPGLTSPQLRRNAQSQQPDKRTVQHRTGSAPRVKSWKIMVPGEVLPPPTPDSAAPSDFSASPSPPPLSPNDNKARIKVLGRPPKTPKPSKPVPETKERPSQTPRVRLPGVTGTNAHSAVAGISTSNALMALTAPPPDAIPGSKWLPWKRLTEYEMATLRKRMKKNAIWLPSPAMRNRELKNLGRGVAAMEEARGTLMERLPICSLLILVTAAAIASGKPFLDEFEPTVWSDPTSLHITDAQQAETAAFLGPEQPDDDQDAALINRGMRLNEAKKLKREKLKAEEAEKLQQEAELKALQEENKEKKTLPKPSQSQSRSQRQSGKSVQSQVSEATKPSEQLSQPAQDQPEPEGKTKPEPKSKKQTKPKLAPEPEAASSERELDISVQVRSEPATPVPAPASAEVTTKPQPTAIAEPATTKKRKRDNTPAVVLAPVESVAESPDVLSLARPGPQPKKLKLSVAAPPPPAPPADKPTIKVSTRAIAAANGMSSPGLVNSPVVESPRVSVRQSQRSQRNSTQPELAAVTNSSSTLLPAANTGATKSGSTTIILKHSTIKAASAEPPIRRQSLRRGSNASLPGGANKNLTSPAPSNTSATENKAVKRPNRKRQPRGVLQTEEHGTNVIVGKPKAAPRKKKVQPKDTKEEAAAATVAEDEVLGPDDQPWCICRDISYGTMILCDNITVSLGDFDFATRLLTRLI
jgi:hypothetical protein